MKCRIQDRVRHTLSSLHHRDLCSNGCNSKREPNFSVKCESFYCIHPRVDCSHYQFLFAWISPRSSDKCQNQQDFLISSSQGSKCLPSRWYHVHKSQWILHVHSQVIPSYLFLKNLVLIQQMQRFFTYFVAWIHATNNAKHWMSFYFFQVTSLVQNKGLTLNDG